MRADGSQGIFRAVSVPRLLQSRKIHVADKCDAAAWKLPAVLDSEPSSLEGGSERRRGAGWDFCLWLESSEHQPEQHAADRWPALQRATAAEDSQHHAAWR